MKKCGRRSVLENARYAVELTPVCVVASISGRRMIEHVFSEASPLGHGLPGDRQTLALETSKAFEKVRIACERVREHLRVRAGLGNTHADVRSSHRGGVADQRDAAVHHFLDHQIIDRRKDGYGAAKQDIA